MSANGIAHLPTREARQKAKLDLAAANRTADGNVRNLYDLDQLPTVYSGNDLIDNPNGGGLVQGRPWRSTTPANLTTEDGNRLMTENGIILTTE